MGTKMNAQREDSDYVKAVYRWEANFWPNFKRKKYTKKVTKIAIRMFLSISFIGFHFKTDIIVAELDKFY